MEKADMEIFSFAAWYPVFQKDSIEAVVLTLPNDVLRYLCGSSGEVSRSTSEEDLTVDWSDEDEYTIGLPNASSGAFSPLMSFSKYQHFTCFDKILKDAINHVGGQAFIKTNWHAPTDFPLVDRLVKCTKVEDVYFLLKRSEVLNKDLRSEYQFSHGQCVVIKKWIDVDRGSEFRCFIKDSSLIGISQRDIENFYAQINFNKFLIMRKIIVFFQENIRDIFAAPNYVVDVIMHKFDFIQIMDFQQLNEESTEQSLFKWEEIVNWIPRVDELGESPDAPDFRFIGPC